MHSHISPCLGQAVWSASTSLSVKMGKQPFPTSCITGAICTRKAREGRCFITHGSETGSYLRGNKVGSVARSHEQPILCSQLLGKPEVTDPDGVRVSRFIHVENITWLEISVHHLNKKAVSNK